MSDNEVILELVMKFLDGSEVNYDEFMESSTLDMESLKKASQILFYANMGAAVRNSDVPEELREAVKSLGNDALVPHAVTSDDIIIMLMSAVMFGLYAEKTLEEQQ